MQPFIVVVAALVAVYVLFPDQVQRVTGILTFPAYPVVGPIKVTEGGAFGVVRSNGKVHKGIDLKAALGTPLVAAIPGKIVNASSNDLSGNFVIVQGSGRFSALGCGYAHLSRIDVKIGDLVEPGDPIGLSGDSGAPGQPHLHFTALRVPGFTFVDPTPFLRDFLGPDAQS